MLNRTLGLLAGNKSDGIRAALVEFCCLPGGHGPVPPVGAGGLNLDGVYVVQNGAEVVPGAADGPFEPADGQYSREFYRGLSYWAFYPDAHPALENVPALDRTGRSLLGISYGFYWNPRVWVVPDARDNAPQLVENARCKDGLEPSEEFLECVRTRGCLDEACEVCDGDGLCLACGGPRPS